MYTPRITNRPNRAGIMTLLAFSMPPPMPNAMMTREITRPMISHAPLPKVKRPLLNIMLTASPRVAASGAAAPNVPPMAPISVPRAYRLPVMPIQQYLKIQPITTV